MSAFIVAVQTSVAAGIMALVVMLVRPFVRRSLPHSLTVLLWGLVFTAFMSPFLLPVTVARVHELVPSSTTHITETVVYVLAVEHAAADSWNISGVTSTSGTVLQTVWVIGMLVLACFFITQRIILSRCFSCAAPVNAEIDDTNLYKKYLSGIKRHVALYTSHHVQTPITYGVIKPKIILPAGFFSADRQLTEHALHHEVQHIRHMDNLFNMLWIVLICVHWFNPLAWLCWVLLKKDMEFRCDAAVVKRLGDSGKAGYARSLLELTPVAGNPHPALSMALSSANIKTRIVHIMGLRKPTILARFMAVLLVAAMLPVFLVSASAVVLPENNVVMQHTTVFISRGSDDYAIIRMRPADSDSRPDRSMYYQELAGFMNAPPEGLEFTGRGFGMGNSRQSLVFAFEGANLTEGGEESASWYKILRISSFRTDDGIGVDEALHYITARVGPWSFSVH